MPNDIEIKQCLYIVLGITVATVITVFLDIPILRQVVGFLFLAFVPGILVLRILKIHNISAIESLVYTVGLSLAFVMFSGVIINFILPLLGIERPIALYPLIITFGISTLILSAVAYKRDKDFIASKITTLLVIPKAPLVFLLTLPVLAIAGVLIVGHYENNILLLLLIIAIATVVGLVSFNKFIPEKAYGLAVAIIAIALLYQVTLSSLAFNLSGDILTEHGYATTVLDTGYAFSRGGMMTTALSIVIVNPVHSIILDMSAISVFRIIYPLFFCLVPLILFHIYRTQLGAKIAFFAAFFFMSVLYSTEMLGLNRQQVAELFIALFILLLVERKLSLVQKTILTTIFAISIIVSHYALGFICAGFFIGTWVVLFFFRHRLNRAFPQKILIGIIVVYLAFMLGWYGTLSSGLTLIAIQRVGSAQAETIVGADPAEPNTKSGAILDLSNREPLLLTALGLDFFKVSPQGKGFRIFQYITELFLIIGFIGLAFRPGRRRLKPEFIVLSMMAVLMLLACIILPRFSGHLESERFYQISLLLLAPLCITGGATIWQAFAHNLKHYFKFVALAVLIPYFLFTSGFIFEITQCEYGVRDTPSSMALSGYRLETSQGEVPQWLK